MTLNAASNSMFSLKFLARTATTMIKKKQHGSVSKIEGRKLPIGSMGLAYLPIWAILLGSQPANYPLHISSLPRS